MYDDLEINAEEELKRADHLIFVTLKYTRTADVIRNILKRLINAYESSILNAMNYKSKTTMTKLTKETIEEVKNKIPEIKKYLKEYSKIKKILKLKYKGEHEFRKGVILVTDIASIDMAKVKNYFDNTQECVTFLKNHFN